MIWLKHISFNTISGNCPAYMAEQDGVDARFTKYRTRHKCVR